MVLFVIEVKLFATLREGREKISFLDAADFKTAKDILNHFAIAEEEVAILLINGRHSKVVNEVKDGDVLALFPPIGGG